MTIYLVTYRVAAIFLVPILFFAVVYLPFAGMEFFIRNAQPGDREAMSWAFGLSMIIWLPAFTALAAWLSYKLGRLMWCRK
ncbi:hypothetical protein XAP3CFBP6996_000680 [Xanthomonas citri pv. fuscans CFBP 6996]|nr:hypothetical protein [Xanthomonas citri]ATS49954.1 hypothetical protein XcfCFBP6992P_02765 [Xanthomonas citri pv. phaseoli var. fuscans]PTY30634.1 hypothetical protein XAP3CFBP6996_000680 [Xanthomonas citri pv. fuscans CFBP 6996]QWN14572.1 hypothetical protein DGN02_00695 [Xanthomonas citri]